MTDERDARQVEAPGQRVGRIGVPRPQLVEVAQEHPGSHAHLAAAPVVEGVAVQEVFVHGHREHPVARDAAPQVLVARVGVVARRVVAVDDEHDRHRLRVIAGIPGQPVDRERVSVEAPQQVGIEAGDAVGPADRRRGVHRRRRPRHAGAVFGPPGVVSGAVRGGLHRERSGSRWVGQVELWNRGQLPGRLAHDGIPEPGERRPRHDSGTERDRQRQQHRAGSTARGGPGRRDAHALRRSGNQAHERTRPDGDLERHERREDRERSVLAPEDEHRGDEDRGADERVCHHPQRRNDPEPHEAALVGAGDAAEQPRDAPAHAAQEGRQQEHRRTDDDETHHRVAQRAEEVEGLRRDRRHRECDDEGTDRSAPQCRHRQLSDERRAPDGPSVGGGCDELDPCRQLTTHHLGVLSGA